MHSKKALISANAKALISANAAEAVSSAMGSVTASCHLWAHVVLTLLLIKLTLLFGGGILILLVLRDEIVHVGFSLGELHLVHALTSVPMKESLSSEHSSELLGDSLEHLLDGGR